MATPYSILISPFKMERGPDHGHSTSSGSERSAIAEAELKLFDAVANRRANLFRWRVRDLQGVFRSRFG
jgi:hypothetical protein